MNVTVIVPTFNEVGNVEPLVRRLTAAFGMPASAGPDGQPVGGVEIVFVDDSTDETPDVISAVSAISSVPVRLIHRSEPVGGLGGAVVEGLRAAASDLCVVMDGDLQHPPELVPVLVASLQESGADVVVASRYCENGRADGLSSMLRRTVSTGATLVTRAMFPRRLRDCTDPMTGFFAVRKGSVDLDELRPKGFKILLEILVRNQLTVVEEPFVMSERANGDSKASLREGLRLINQLAALRFGRMSKFAVVGAIGTVLNLMLMAALLGFGVHYLAAAIIATETTILTNFVLQEVWVFADLRADGHRWWVRMVQSVGFNNIETAIRVPILVLIVERTAIPSLLAQAITLGAAFLIRFIFVSRVVYRPRRGVEAVVPSTDVDAVRATSIEVR